MPVRVSPSKSVAAGSRKDEGRDVLRRALELAHRLGATALDKHTRRELLAAGGRSMTNKAIAQELFGTPKTVEVHLSSVYRTLAISSRSDLHAALA